MHEPTNPTIHDPARDARSPDPGSPKSRRLALLATLIGIVLVVGWQNLPERIQFGVFGGAPPETQLGPDTSAPGAFGQADILARIFIRGKRFFTDNDAGAGPMVMSNIDQAAAGPEDRVRAIIMSAEFESADAALERIDELESDILDRRRDEDKGGGPYHESPRTELVLDELDALETIYTRGRDAIDQPMRDQLETRYGVVGRAATTHGLDPTHPEREPIVTGFWAIGLFMLAVGLGAVLAPIVGAAILIVGIVVLGRRRTPVRRFEPPAPGGSVYLETYAVFLLGFAIMALGTTAIAVLVDPALALLSLPLQWILLITPGWALARGADARSWRAALGLHRGTGLFREIGAGVLSYLACVPIYYAAVVVSLVLIMIWSMIERQLFGVQDQQSMPVNPVFEIIASGNALAILLIFTLATVWAPLTEELVFRGALHRHLRARMHWVGAAALGAVLFAFMHSYGPLLVAPLIALGFAFSLVREWRGSIIAPITMHFIHNATLMTIMITMAMLLGDPG